MEPGEYERMYRVEREHFWFVGSRDIILDVLTRTLGGAEALAASEVVDVGCGTGYTLSRLEAVGHRARRVGVDISERAIELARTRDPASEFVCADAAAVPIPDESFDVATALDVLEHVSDDVTVAREVHRLLRPGGIFLATVPAFSQLWSPHDEALHHHRRYRLHEIQSTVRRAGFEIEMSTYYNTVLFPLVAAVRLARRVIPLLRRINEAETPAWPLNRAFHRMFSSERHVVGRTRLPFGVSALVVARKPS